MLTRSSVLHYWSSRYGPLPVIGGNPVMSRNSAGSTVDARGSGGMYDAIINTPRLSWETDQSTSANERRAMMLLELARTNNIPYSLDLSAWSNNAMTVVGGTTDPLGKTNAQTLTATGASAYKYKVLSAGSSLARTNALWVRRRTGSGGAYIYAPDGTGFIQPIAPTSDWQRFFCSTGASVNRYHGIKLDVSGDAIDIYNAQQEDGAFATSDVVNLGSSATARAVDAFSWQHLAPPQGMMIHLRFVERGTILMPGTAGLLTIGAGGFATPDCTLFSFGGVYRWYYRPAGTDYVLDAVGTPALGNTVDLVAIATPTGSIRLIQSLNGLGVTDSGTTAGAAYPASWSAPEIHLGAGFGTAYTGANAFADLKIVKYADVAASGGTAQAIMDELKAFELNVAGDVL